MDIDVKTTAATKYPPIEVVNTKDSSAETEPIFDIHLEFNDGPKPIDYYNLNLMQATKVLQDWSEEWILFPHPSCTLAGGKWVWTGNKRKINKLKKSDGIEHYSDILSPSFPSSEFTEPEE